MYFSTLTIHRHRPLSQVANRVFWESHGAKGFHIGPHATLFTDILLKDMEMQTGHIHGTAEPRQLLREWFRPMLPEIYRSVAVERLAREESRDVMKKYGTNRRSKVVWGSNQGAIAWASRFLAMFLALCFSLAYVLA